MSSSQVLKRTLYRSLIRTAKPFSLSKTPQSVHPSVLSSLLYRSTISSNSLLQKNHQNDDDGSSFYKGQLQDNNSEQLFYELLVEYLNDAAVMTRRSSRSKPDSKVDFIPSNVFSSLNQCGPMMRFPSQINLDKNTLLNIIRREFRIDKADHAYTLEARMGCGFHALRELNKKLVWYESMAYPSNGDHHRYPKAFAVEQARKDNMFTPGVYLVAHPLQTGYFSKTVIVILDHSDEGGTYGLIVNRSKEKKFKEVLQVDQLPKTLVDSFGNNIMRDGGPVHVSIQMMYSCTAEEEAEYALEGNVLPCIPPPKKVASNISGMITHEDEEDSASAETERISSAALLSDEAIFFRGNVGRASELILEQISKDKEADENMKTRKLTSEDFVFFSGSSVWESGQLESEVGRGFWIPCFGPPSIALSGKCVTDNGDEVEDDELWLAMMGSIGKHEADLASLLLNDALGFKYGLACDEMGS